MGVRQAGVYSTADAVIRTEVQVNARNAIECVLRTEVTYRWPYPVRVGKRAESDRLTKDAVEFELRHGDRLTIRDAWGQLFDYVAEIHSSAPVSLNWELNIRALRRGDVWLRGAVQTLVEIVSEELGVAVRIVGI